MSEFVDFNIGSGVQLKHFIEACGIDVKRSSEIENSNNCIYIDNYASFNWKGRVGSEKIRFNCKEEDKDLIERNTCLKGFDNSRSDKTHPWSFLIDNMSDMIDVLYILKNKC